MSALPAATARIVAPARRRASAWLGAVVALVLAVALVAVADFPTGSPAPQGVLPSDARLTARARVGDVEVLLASRPRGLALVVAYQEAKGWFGLALDPVDRQTAAATTTTRGRGEVPPLSAVYGRVTGDRVRANWSDGRRSEAAVQPDGTYLIVRPGAVRLRALTVLDGDGDVVEEVREP